MRSSAPAIRFTAAIIAGSSLLALVACSKAADQAGSNAAADAASSLSGRASLDVKPEPAAAPALGIDIKGAPGVAFRYGYAFVLPDAAIAALQEAHAAACEQLGPSQCRITGMRYVLLDEHRVEAQLQLKLARERARAFGKDAVGAAERAKGRLVNAEITGDDVGARIIAAQTEGSNAEAELGKVNAELAGNLSRVRREDLQRQAGDLRSRIGEARGARSAGEEQLASTPMTLSYTGEQGYAIGGDPLGEASHAGWRSLVTMVSAVLMVAGVALPWLALALALLAVWRTAPVRRVRDWVLGLRSRIGPSGD